MPLSYTQREVIKKIVEALEEFLTRHEFTICDDEIDLSIRLKQSQEFEKRIHNLENIIRPDETDVYNINRRIELLAQRIATLENKKRGG